MSRVEPRFLTIRLLEGEAVIDEYTFEASKGVEVVNNRGGVAPSAELRAHLMEMLYEQDGRVMARQRGPKPPTPQQLRKTFKLVR